MVVCKVGGGDGGVGVVRSEGEMRIREEWLWDLCIMTGWGDGGWVLGLGGAFSLLLLILLSL